jgi:TDG/mug DNA glycosylase family protein
MHHNPPTSRHKGGLPAFIPPEMKVLVLGSFPSRLSLEREKYYANPRNQFWRIMESVCDVPHDAPYETRLSGIADAGIGLFDVITSCERRGSQDRAISSPVFNDFSGIFADFPSVSAVLANGLTAFGLFVELCSHSPLPQGVEVIRCPSTSPAYAAISLGEKTERWTRALKPFIAGCSKKKKPDEENGEGTEAAFSPSPGVASRGRTPGNSREHFPPFRGRGHTGPRM